MSTYGQHRDQLAHNLAVLLARPDHEPQLRAAETRRVLAYRDLLLTSLSAITAETLAGAAGVNRSLAAAAHAPARALRSTLQDLPAASAPAPPTQTLAVTPTTRYARTWRSAASNALLAADALAAGEPPTWRTEPDAAWAVMADTAAAVHALAILDRRLATHPTPHLDDTTRQVLSASWRSGLRLVASEVSRLAHSQPLSDQADRLTRPPALRPFPLTDATQLAAGYQHTVRLLEARDGILPLRTLGHLLIAQARISHTVADHCEGAHAAGIHSADELARGWRQRAVTAETLASHRRAVAGLNPGIRHPALAQAGEVLRVIERMPSASRHQQHLDAVNMAQEMQHTGRRIEYTIAASIERSFARDLYLVANEYTTKVRGRHPGVSVRHNFEQHPMLTAAREIRAAASATPSPLLSHPAPSPRARHELVRALNAVEPVRTGPPARSLQY